jgi:hypothetical protein
MMPTTMHPFNALNSSAEGLGGGEHGAHHGRNKHDGDVTEHDRGNAGEDFQQRFDNVAH